MNTTKIVMAAALLSLCAAPILAQGGNKVGGMGQGVSHGSISKSGMKGHGSSAKAKATTSGNTVGEKLAKNPKLASKIEKLLGNGMSAQDACSGFKNLGQCTAAIHVSRNLGVSFTDLKARMVDSATNTQHESLGKAIQDLKPAANAKVEAKKATKQAKADMKATHS